LALLSQRSRWLLAAARNPLLRLLRLLRLLTLLLRLPLRLLMPLPRLPLRLPTLLLRPLLRLRRPLRRRTDPIGSGMKARAGREPACTGFRVFAALRIHGMNFVA
jgi:hypothetical protein